jgi:hypothetical protein
MTEHTNVVSRKIPLPDSVLFQHGQPNNVADVPAVISLYLYSLQV